jgi:hypothetical protein
MKKIKLKNSNLRTQKIQKKTTKRKEKKEINNMAGPSRLLECAAQVPGCSSRHTGAPDNS